MLMFYFLTFSQELNYLLFIVVSYQILMATSQ